MDFDNNCVWSTHKGGHCSTLAALRAQVEELKDQADRDCAARRIYLRRLDEAEDLLVDCTTVHLKPGLEQRISDWIKGGQA